MNPFSKILFGFGVAIFLVLVSSWWWDIKRRKQRLRADVFNVELNTSNKQLKFGISYNTLPEKEALKSRLEEMGKNGEFIPFRFNDKEMGKCQIKKVEDDGVCLQVEMNWSPDGLSRYCKGCSEQMIDVTGRLQDFYVY